MGTDNCSGFQMSGSAYAICLHMGLSLKGHRAAYALPKSVRYSLITKSRGYKVEESSTAQGAQCSCVSLPHRLLLWCQTTEGTSISSFCFCQHHKCVGTGEWIQAILLSTSTEHTHQCRYISELNSKFCVDYSMRKEVRYQ